MDFFLAAIMVKRGGSIDLHGTQFKTWTRLRATIKAGTGALALQEPVDWKPGQLVTIATSIWKDEVQNQNEVHTIRTVSDDNRILQTEEMFQYYHFGCASKTAMCDKAKALQTLVKWMWHCLRRDCTSFEQP